MTQDSKETVDDVPLGRYEGDRYFLNIAEDSDNPDSWCVSVVRESASDSNTNVARIDTDHGRPHLDKPWLPPDERDKDWFDHEFSRNDAIDEFVENWRVYAWRYAFHREEREVTDPR